MVSKMFIKHIDDVKKVTKVLGETATFQIFWEGEDQPKTMKSDTHFVKITIPPEGTNTVHVHEDQEQIYIILEGKGNIQVGDEKAMVKAGDAVFLPIQVPHGFFNTSKITAKILLVSIRV